MKNTAKQIAFCGVMSALLFVLLLLETYVLIYFIKPSPAVLSIPFAISLSVFKGKKYALLGGTALGVCSFVCSFIVAYEPFFNPLISILPRVLMGIFAFLICTLVKKSTSRMKNEKLKSILPYSVAGAAGVLFNTVTVITMLFVFEQSSISAVITTILSVNFLAEFISGIILTPLLCSIMNKFVND